MKPPLSFEITLRILAHHHTRAFPVAYHTKTITGSLDRGRARSQLGAAFEGILAALKREREAAIAEQPKRQKRYYD